MESYIRKNLYFFINQFTACWVPDIADCEQSLAGSLSHPVIMPSVPTKYIGWLSRFEKMPIVEKKYLLTISISGPEPQRTLLEEMLLLQLEYIEGQILLIRGLPGNAVTPRAGKHIQIVNHLSAADMQAAFMQSSFVVSRSGYSTVMDMQVLGCKCIYIPTPGQTEQEYIGSILLMRKMGLVKKQQGFNLAAALDEAQFFPFYTHSDTANNQLAGSVIVQWLKEIV